MIQDTHDPSLYGHKLPKHEHVQQPVTERFKPQDSADLHQWFESFSGFWIAGILPIVLAWFAWRSLKLKVQQHNKLRREKHEALNKEQSYSDDTVLDWARKQMKK